MSEELPILESILDRIAEYLQRGGLFNPEMMEHDKVRDLLMGCRQEIISRSVETSRLRVALERLRDGDFVGIPINKGCGAMMLIEEALSLMKGETK